MKKKLGSVAILAFALALCLTACSSGSENSSNVLSGESGAATSEEPYVMKICTATAEGNRQTESIELLKEYIEENSNGRIKVETYPAGQMGSATQVHQLLLANEVQGLAEPTAFMVGFCDELTMLDLPFMMDYDRISLEDISEIFNSDIVDPIREACEAKGLYLAGVNNMTYRMAMTKFPVSSLSDLSGKKVRCGNTLLQEEWNMLGATGIIISVPELYTALQQGTVDAHESDYSFFNSGKYYEVAPYLMDIPLGTQNSVHLYNLEWLESLPEDLQEVVKSASPYVRPTFEANCVADVEEFRNVLWPELGITFCEISDEMAAEMKEKLAGMSEMYLEDNPSMRECYNNIVAAAESRYTS